jgi:hypothetical protein
VNPNRCASCDAPIVWARTQRAERMPVDAEPDAERGNVILTGQPPDVRAGVLSRGQAEGARASGQRLHTSHFATCPYAGQHRTRDQRKPARRRGR